MYGLINNSKDAACASRCAASCPQRKGRSQAQSFVICWLRVGEEWIELEAEIVSSVYLRGVRVHFLVQVTTAARLGGGSDEALVISVSR